MGFKSYNSVSDNTSAYLAVVRLLAAKSVKSREIPREFDLIMADTHDTCIRLVRISAFTAVCGHPRSPIILVSIGSAYATY